MTEEITNLKLIGFSIEVETDPVTLLLQTDRAPFSVEIPKAQLSNLIYALRFVLRRRATAKEAAEEAGRR